MEVSQVLVNQTWCYELLKTRPMAREFHHRSTQYLSSTFLTDQAATLTSFRTLEVSKMTASTINVPISYLLLICASKKNNWFQTGKQSLPKTTLIKSQITWTGPHDRKCKSNYQIPRKLKVWLLVFAHLPVSVVKWSSIKSSELYTAPNSQRWSEL